MLFRKIRARIVPLIVLATTAAAISAQAQERLRISLDTNASHVRNKGAEIFITELKSRVGDKLAPELYPSAQLFRDRDIPRALRQGAIEMGIPGTWQLDGVEPNMAIQTLPMFYAVEAAIVQKVMDGKLGNFLNKRMEDRMKVKILGRWADLGMQHYYSSTRPINAYGDLAGMKMRFPGGSANSARIKAQGAVPTLIPFPDLPLAMSQGVVDGVSTTHESAASAKLYDSGLKYAFEDNQYMGQYVPMVNRDFWNRLSPDVQKGIVEAWETAASKQRVMAEKAQIDARETLVKHGVKMAQPAPEAAVAMRKTLMALQDGLVKDMKIDADAVEIAKEELRSAQVSF
jgi:TRAP-type C4-dicarboxylate transport system substrate-binding protein